MSKLEKHLIAESNNEFLDAWVQYHQGIVGLKNALGNIITREESIDNLSPEYQQLREIVLEMEKFYAKQTKVVSKVSHKITKKG